MDIVEIHEKYHSKVKLQKRIIGSTNFTYRNLLKILDIYSKKTNRLLDVGCGVGTLDFYLATNVRDVSGIDISKKAIRMARLNARVFGIQNLKFYVGDVNKFQLFSKFDLILCSEIIEHVENDKKLLVDLNKHLKKDGLIFLSTPLESAPLYRMGLTKTFDRRVGHMRRYTLKKLNFLVKKNGLKIVNVYYQDGIFRNKFFVFGFFDPLVRIANRFTFVSDAFTFIDEISLRLFGPSDIALVIKKK